MKRSISAILLAVFLVGGCAQKRMTQFEYRDIRLEAGGKVRRPPALAMADFKPGSYYSLDRQTAQVEIEVKLIEFSRRDTEILGVNWLADQGQLLEAASVRNTTPESSPMAMGGMVNIGIGGGSSRGGGCPHGPGCRKCGSGRGGGLGGGVGFPVLTGEESGKKPGVTEIIARFDLDEAIRLTESYLAIELIVDRTSSGKLVVQPLLLPIIVEPKDDPKTEQPVVERSTTVRVRDDETILIGGLVTDSEEAIKAKTPILGDIPMLGRLFRSKSRHIKKRELIIFLTPRIILTEE